jgi:hypothetical protein
MIVKVRNAKKERPTLADVIKTGATQSGEVVLYIAAWRALQHESGAQLRVERKNFELIVPHIEQLKKKNHGSVIGCQSNDDHHITDVYVFPRFMKDLLLLVRPVVSMDAAHLRSVHKGTHYVASILSGTNEVDAIGLMISTENEDGPTWTRMLEHLSDACPILLEQGLESGLDIDGETDGEYYCHPCVFMSDCDKGLKPALRRVFPGNLSVDCAKHIQANVKAKFGQLCARYVIQLAKTFSTRISNDVLDEIRNIKPEAADYIESVEEVWRLTEWMDSRRNLPP